MNGTKNQQQINYFDDQEDDSPVGFLKVSERLLAANPPLMSLFDRRRERDSNC